MYSCNLQLIASYNAIKRFTTSTIRVNMGMLIQEFFFQQAIMEEADLRLAETKKESYEFERDIVKGAMNPRTGKVIAEKVTRYLDEKNRSRVGN